MRETNQDSAHFRNDTVAAYLGFHDATNVRRPFKRWTGQTPGLLRDALHV